MGKTKISGVEELNERAQSILDDHGAQDRARLRVLIGWLKGTKKNSAILDLGCAAGAVGAMFKSMGHKVYGTDIAPGKHYITDTKINYLDCYDRVLQHDANKKMPFRSGMFDVVWAGEFIEHICNTTLFLRECWRVLKPGGKLILTAPNINSFANRVAVVTGRYPWYVSASDCGISYGDVPEHVRTYNKKILAAVVERENFIVEEISGDFVPLTFWHHYPEAGFKFMEYLAKPFPGFAERIIILAHKNTGRNMFEARWGKPPIKF